jgi:hypothetical protein
VSRNPIYVALGLIPLIAELTKPKRQQPSQAAPAAETTTKDMSDTHQQRSHKPRRKRLSIGRWIKYRLVRLELVDAFSSFAAWGAALNGACLLVGAAFIVSAYTQLASVTAGDICVPSHFVAATVARAQLVIHSPAQSAVFCLLALGIGRWELRSRRTSLVAVMLLQVFLLVYAAVWFDPLHTIHLLADREWFSAEQIQARWADFHKLCDATMQSPR